MIIMDDGIQLNAQLDLPEDGRKKCPVVVIIHGFTGNMNEWHISETSRALNRIGFATLRADMYGMPGPKVCCGEAPVFRERKLPQEP